MIYPLLLVAPLTPHVIHDYTAALLSLAAVDFNMFHLVCKCVRQGFLVRLFQRRAQPPGYCRRRHSHPHTPQQSVCREVSAGGFHKVRRPLGQRVRCSRPGPNAAATQQRNQSHLMSLDVTGGDGSRLPTAAAAPQHHRPARLACRPSVGSGEFAQGQGCVLPSAKRPALRQVQRLNVRSTNSVTIRSPQ